MTSKQLSSKAEPGGLTGHKGSKAQRQSSSTERLRVGGSTPPLPHDAILLFLFVGGPEQTGSAARNHPRRAKLAVVAQSVEQLPCKQQVVVSNTTGSSKQGFIKSCRKGYAFPQRGALLRPKHGVLLRCVVSVKTSGRARMSRPSRGCRITVVPQPSKLVAPVRFRSSAPRLHCPSLRGKPTAKKKQRWAYTMRWQSMAECAGLLNLRAPGLRGFKSHPHRQQGGTCKCVSFLSSFLLRPGLFLWAPATMGF